jgi:tungstate transport system substrate-binding protein
MVTRERVTNMRRRLALLLGIGLLVAACSASSSASPQPSATAPAASGTPAPAASPTPVPRPSVATNEIILATTTSTQDSGLLDALIPAFEKASGYKVKTVAVGSGQALAMGKAGNADVLLVHSPAAEKEFMDGGYGVDRRLVMHNDFVIVGPASDPAGVKGTKTAVDGMKAIAGAQSPFISRGDKSGTNAAELALWKKAGITPQGAWYQESGQGMGATLTIASEKGAYTLTDRSTYLAQKDKLDLEILLQGDPALLNIYHVISVDPAKWPIVNAAGATAFADYLTSSDGQALIGAFGLDKYGQQLFFPDAGKTDEELTKAP